MDSLKLKGKITRTYAIALVVISLLMTAAYVYSLRSHVEQEMFPRIINLSGKQRMLSQRIALLQQLVVKSENLSQDETEKLQRELGNRADEFELNHRILTGKQQIDGYTTQLSEKMRNHYYGGIWSLDAQVSGYVDKARLIASLPLEILATAEPVKVSETSTLLSRLDQAVFMFEEELIRKFTQQQQADLVVWITINGFMLLAVIILFRPLEKLVLSQFRLASSAKDIARRERTNANRANQVKTEFVAKMSHEFRTPMNAIIGTLELLPNMRDKQEVLIKRAERACYRMLHLTNNLLEIMGSDTVVTPPKREPFDLIRVLDDCISPIAAATRDNNIDLLVTCDSALPHYVEGFPSSVAKALQNILDNAVKFTDKGEISVAVSLVVEKRKFILSIEVTDSGIGMRPNDLDIIFERFTQVFTGPKYLYPGAGVGLAVAKEKLAPIGGSIKVISSLGAGSTFTIQVPVYPSSIKHRVDADANLGKFAIIDDLEISRLHLSNLIATEGFEVDSFRSAAEFLAKREQIPDYVGIISDYYMPGIDGVELASAISAMLGKKAPPVVLISATPDIANIVALKETKVWQTFVKPLDINRVIDSLHQIANSKGSISVQRREAAILIVEDEPVNGEIIQYMVSNLGYESTLVKDGEDAINKCSMNQFDLILMDITLPDISGIEVANILREKGITTPIVAVTANAYESDKLETRQAGMRYHLVKPVTYQELKNTISLALSLNG